MRQTRATPSPERRKTWLPVYGLGHTFSFAVRINQMPGGPIIAQRPETHLPAIADDAMEQTADPLKRGRKIRRETMKTMLLAAAAALSLGVGSAYADGGEGPAANTLFTELPGVVAQAQVPNAPVYAQNGQQNRQAQTHRPRTARRRTDMVSTAPSRATALGCSRQTLTTAPTANPKRRGEAERPAHLPALSLTGSGHFLPSPPLLLNSSPGTPGASFCARLWECRNVPPVASSGWDDGQRKFDWKL